MVEEVHWGRPWLGLSRAHLSGSPSSTLARQGPAQGERGCSGVLLSSSVSNGAMLYGGSGFRHNIPINRAPPSLPFLQDGSSQRTHSSPLPGSALQTPHSSTQPLSAVLDTLSGWVGRAGVSTLCAGLTLSCCHRLLLCSLPTENEAPLLSQLGSPTSEELPRMWRLSSLQIAPELQVPLHFLSCSFSFIFLLSFQSRNYS